MRYYQVVQVPRKLPASLSRLYTLVCGELFTAREYDKYGFHTYCPGAFNIVDIKPHDTFFFFGARFHVDVN